jgi:hypothetical protein
MYMCITIHIGSSLSDLFATSWSPSHSGFSQFTITVFTPLQWTHQPIQILGFLPFPIPSMHILALVCENMSSNITAFVLGVKSIYKGEHAIFSLLSLANFA